MTPREQQISPGIGKAEPVVQILIVLSLFCYAVQTSPDLSEEWEIRLKLFEWFTLVFFTAEYLARVALAKNRKGYIFSFFGIIDLLSFLPSYFALGLDLRAIRAFRLLRLFRVLKLARYSAAICRLHRAFTLVREELVLFGAVSIILLFLSAAGIHYFEHQAQPQKFSSVFECLWWAITSLTTVGYGDAYPITVGGRVFTFFVLVIGLGVVAVPTGMFSSALSQAREDIEE